MSLDIQNITSYLLALLIGGLGWVATYLVGKPYLAYRALRAEIARCLILYANIPRLQDVTAPLPPRTAEARTKYRELGSELIACANTIAFYPLWSFLHILPAHENLETAKGNLIGLSNSIGEPDQGLEISRREDNIRRLLKIN